MIQTTTLNHVVHQLEPSIEKVLNDYQQLIKQAAPLDPKEFTAYQNACKSALAHLMLLTKLIQNEPEQMEEPFFQNWAEAIQNAPDLKQEVPDDFE